MKLLITVDEGFEHTAASEIEPIIKTIPSIKKQALLIEVEPLTALQIASTTQSICRVIALIDSFTFAHKDELTQKLNTLCSEFSFNDWLPGKEFSFHGERSGTHEFNTGYLFSLIVPLIKKHTQKSYNKNSVHQFFCKIVDNCCYVGIDITGKDLSKRDYRLFIHPSDINASFAYHLLHSAGYTGKEKLLVAYCSSGTLLLEAVLQHLHRSPSQHSYSSFAFHTIPIFSSLSTNTLSNTPNEEESTKNKATNAPSIFGFDKSKMLKFTKKNAKLAQLPASSFTLDEQFPSENFDIIVARLNPPHSHKATMQPTSSEKFLNNFFKQAHNILSEKGKLLCFSNNITSLESTAKDNNFSIEKQESIFRGDMHYRVFLLCKNKPK